jgi:fused signal recognition particle receptor
MNGANSNSLSTVETLEQMIKILGFHDLGSFIWASLFSVAAIVFVILMAIFFVKKSRERKAELLKVVTEVQREFKEPETLKPEQKLEPQKEEKLEPVQTIKDKEQPKPEPRKEVKLEPIEKPVQTVKEPEQKLEIIPKEEPVKISEPKSLGSALKNTRHGFIAKLGRLFSNKASISDQDFEEIEAILFTADIGAKTAQKLLDGLKSRANTGDKNFLHQALKEEMQKIFLAVPKKEEIKTLGPKVIMFVGVNGAGKTTSIGKLGAQLAEHHKVIFGAGDTFRAAAVEQLVLWGQRSNIEVVCGKENSDSASVLFEAIQKGKAMGVDYVLCDTAGRLHTKVSLMEELSKVHRVMSKALEGAPHEVYLVVDATMGQNAIAQAREFKNATPLTGIILSKLDGTAKGGVALGIVDELKVPISYVGIGEKILDLKDFNAEEFIDALLEEV